MGNQKEPIRYIFLHFDGVILENILAPITYSVVKKLGGAYTAEIENNVFARSQEHAAGFIIKELKLNLSIRDVIQLYYSERKQYEATHEIKMNRGVEKLLALLASLGYEMIAYGGAPKEYFLDHAKSLYTYFSQEKYIQTKDFRPGIKEMVFERHGLKPWEALIIDEEVTIAETSQSLGVPFIGMTTGYEYSFQKSEMKKLGVKYIIDSLEEIDLPFLHKVQEDVANEKIWRGPTSDPDLKIYERI